MFVHMAFKAECMLSSIAKLLRVPSYAGWYLKTMECCRRQNFNGIESK
ncbi:putative Blumeria graminis specific protein [Blumeria hordei DH14]|uniref:Putative Blumeria graminis specific protein n=1 Tax=Blumeria graminis f. sp. hordei (strain DH14) TaxID=546991 RepID=N1JIH4_BLUG1|nr:putative Blumeria graminis specific protein [Blumeria hordei DH14]